MKKIALLLLFIIPSLTYCQISKSAKMDQTTLEELKMTVYDKDSSAVAVVLYDQGNLYLYNNNLGEFRTDNYFRIKILKKDGFRKATIKIPFYDKQEIKNIEAITYNLSDGSIKKDKLKEENIFKTTVSGEWKEISFALPNVTVGSVIEYSYTLVNPYMLHIDDWYFQDDIPKIKSEYDSSIVGNYRYNVKLNGYFPLTKDNPSVKKRCVEFLGDGYSKLYGDCSVSSYAMENVPAFIEEDYLTSRDNFISRVSFQLESLTYQSGKKEEFTNSWKSVDRKFKSGEYFGSEIRKSSFLKKNIPSQLLEITDELDKAQSIYYYIQNHYTLNNDNFSFQRIDTKQSFDEKKGTVADINMALYNALNSANLSTAVVLVSTREKGVPTKLYPIITEFNYLLVKISINDEDYFLDASNKNLSFGVIPFRTLNGDARVMDFENESYWNEVTSSEESSENINMSMTIGDDGIVNGKLRMVNSGYDAYYLRSELNQTNENDYKDDFASKNKIEINDYKVSGIDKKEKQLIQTFDFNLENKSDFSDKIYLNPFFFEKLNTNPFKLETRFYPVNFGYKQSYSYRANITIPDNFTIGELPESRAFTLPNNGGRFLYSLKKIDSKIAIHFKYELSKTIYNSEEYFALKEFFKQIIKAQSTLITLEKKQ